MRLALPARLADAKDIHVYIDHRKLYEGKQYGSVILYETSPQLGR